MNRNEDEADVNLQRISVTLIKIEWDAAESLGVKRQTLREQRGKSGPEYRDNGGTHRQRNAIGSVAEYALAKHYDREYPGTLRDWTETKAFSLEHWKIRNDVGGNLHVRASLNPRARLLTYAADPDDGAFVLAVIYPEALKVVFLGWEFAKNTKYQEYWDDYSPGFREPGRACYAYPQDMLLPMASIRPEDVRL